jgi:hypothetical protein
VTIAWEWPGDVTQAMIFLLDFGLPWRGSVKDMLVSKYFTRRELHRNLIDGSLEQRKVPYWRARQFVLDALKSNRRHGMQLPEDFNTFRALMERRILNPSPKALEQAAALDASTVDEWGELAEPVVRGLEIIDGSPTLVLDESDIAALRNDPGDADEWLDSVESEE